MKRYLGLIAACAVLFGCAQKQESYQYYLQGKNVELPGAEKFQHCYGYGCKRVINVALNNKEWREIDTIFQPAPKSAARERQAVSVAIGVMETLVGGITGTKADIAGTFKNLGRYQHDCVDESTNTTVYLALLEKRGHLRFHSIEGPTTRVPLIDYMGRWPHQTAVISEKETGKFYAVDSWFHDNGKPAEIVTLRRWKAGWKPGEK